MPLVEAAAPYFRQPIHHCHRMEVLLNDGQQSSSILLLCYLHISIGTWVQPFLTPKPLLLEDTLGEPSKGMLLKLLFQQFINGYC